MKKLILIAFLAFFSANVYSQEVGIKLGTSFVNENFENDDSQIITKKIGVYYIQNLTDNLNLSVSYQYSFGVRDKNVDDYMKLLWGHNAIIDVIYDFHISDNLNLKLGLGTGYVYNIVGDCGSYNMYYYDIEYAYIPARLVLGAEYRNLFDSRFSLELIASPAYLFKIYDTAGFFHLFENNYNKKISLMLGVKFDLVK